MGLLTSFELGMAGLITAYAGLAIILLSLHIYSSWHPVIKGFATLMVLALCAVTYQSHPRMLGWPTQSDELPSRLYIYALHVHEPDIVYLWGRDLDEGLGQQRPRAYALPYSQTLHQEVDKIGSKLRRNIAVIAEIEAGNIRQLNWNPETSAVIKTSRIRFIDAPEGLLPVK